MRGKALSSIAFSPFGGITPAYAGKRRLLRRMTQTTKDHPRLCGEKAFHSLKPLLPLGSPPPMRGKVAGYQLRYIYFRITPAYAGKS